MKDPRTESVLCALGVKFEYDPEYLVTALVCDPTTQVRRQENQAPQPEVRRYYDLLKAGAEFPPVIVTRISKAVIDGNTRTGAYVMDRRPTIPAYVVDVTAPAVAKLIGVELNSVAGRRMEKAELAEWLASSNGSVSVEAAQRLTGWSPRTVVRVRAALKFNERADKLGVKVISVLPEATREALMKVTDAACFRALIGVTDDAGITATELKEIVGQINDLSLVDTEAALARITELRNDRAQQIEERRAGLRVTTPLFREISRHGGWLIRQGPSGLHDVSPHTAARSQRCLEEISGVVKEALTRYPA